MQHDFVFSIAQALVIRLCNPGNCIAQLHWQRLFEPVIPTSKHSAEARPRAKEASMTSSATSMAGGGAKCAAAEVRTLVLCSGVGRLPICLRSLSEDTWTHTQKDQFCLNMHSLPRKKG